MSTTRQKILVIVGPTASGKSALAVELAKKFDGEIISADSRQVYRGLDIGTGKVTKREMKGVPHYLLDVATPQRAYSAAKFVKTARREIDRMAKRGKLPIVVGGTGFYIDALVGRISLPDVAPDTNLRKKLSEKTLPQLHAMLRRKDPARAEALSSPSERNNKVRLIRAVEIASAEVSPRQVEVTPSYEALWIGIAPDDTKLREKIGVRLKERIRKGMVAEAKRLHADGLSYKRMRALGLEYRSLARLLQGEISRGELERELESDIWRYSRKQLGYWKRNKEIRWFKPTEITSIRRAAAAWFQANPGK